MRLKKNLIYSTIYQFYILIIPLITAPYISRVLGVEAIGIYSYTHSIVYYFMLFSMLGVTNYGSKLIASVKNDRNKLSENFINIYIVQLITGIIALNIYLVVIKQFNGNLYNILLAQTPFIISSILDINWFYFGLEEFRLTVSRNIAIKTSSLIFIFVFVKTKEDLLIYTLIMSIAMLISQSIVWLIIKKYICFKKPIISEIKKHLKNNLIYFVPVLSFSLYKIMDKIMIGSIVGMTQLGFYENASKLVSLPVSFITATGTVMLPHISNLISEKESLKVNQYILKSFKIMSLITFPIAFGMMAVSEKLVVVFFGIEFAESAPLIIYLAPTIILIAWANIIRTQYLIPHDRQKTYLVSTILAALINLTLNYFLIPKFLSFGAVIATLIAEFTVTTIILWETKNELPINEYIRGTFNYLIYSLIMFILTRHIGGVMSVSIVSLLIQIIAGITIYSLLILFTYFRHRSII